MASVEGLDASGKVIAEYIWLGGAGTDLRSKSKVLSRRPSSAQDLAPVTVDGSCCGQASVDSCEVVLKPCRLFKDPFRGGEHLLVLCDTYLPPAVPGLVGTSAGTLQPHPTNNRAACDIVLQRASTSEALFTIEQEYTLLDPVTSWPIGWPSSCQPNTARASYGAGTGDVAGREVAEALMVNCLKAGIRLSGSAAGGVPGQWSFDIGPSSGLDVADHLWVARYILLRLSEQFKVVVSFSPKPVPGDWTGTGCFVKYSTRETRQPVTGLFAIQQQIQRLHACHLQHVMAYGHGNLKRVFGKSISSPDSIKFSCGFSNKASSIMIPRATVLSRGGYYVDRRPASNMDPYLVTMLLVSTTLGMAPPSSTACAPLPAGNLLPAAQCPAPSQSANRSSVWLGSSCTSGSRTANTEDVLIDELDKLDKFAPDTPPNHPNSILSHVDSSDECSDGTSPEHDVAAGGAREDMNF